MKEKLHILKVIKSFVVFLGGMLDCGYSSPLFLYDYILLDVV